MEREPQNTWLYKFMNQGKTISRKQAAFLFGIERLAARVHDVNKILDVVGDKIIISASKPALYKLVPQEPGLTRKQLRDKYEGKLQ